MNFLKRNSNSSPPPPQPSCQEQQQQHATNNSSSSKQQHQTQSNRQRLKPSSHEEEDDDEDVAVAGHDSRRSPPEVTPQNGCSSSGKKTTTSSTKKRKSKSASSFIRRLFTCAGVVGSCTGGGANANNESNQQPNNNNDSIFRRISASSRRSQSKSVSNINQPIEETANNSNNVLLMGGHHTVEEELNIDLLAPESLLSSLTPATKKQLVPPILKLNDNDLLITSNNDMGGVSMEEDGNGDDNIAGGSSSGVNVGHTTFDSSLMDDEAVTSAATTTAAEDGCDEEDELADLLDDDDEIVVEEPLDEEEETEYNGDDEDVQDDEEAHHPTCGLVEEEDEDLQEADDADRKDSLPQTRSDSNRGLVGPRFELSVDEESPPHKFAQNEANKNTTSTTASTAMVEIPSFTFELPNKKKDTTTTATTTTNTATSNTKQKQRLGRGSKAFEEYYDEEEEEEDIGEYEDEENDDDEEEEEEEEEDEEEVDYDDEDNEELDEDDEEEEEEEESSSSSRNRLRRRRRKKQQQLTTTDSLSSPPPPPGKLKKKKKQSLASGGSSKQLKSSIKSNKSSLGPLPSSSSSNPANPSSQMFLGPPKIANFYSKFLTANNIITDRGCIVNIRTGSFNLGCAEAASMAASSSSLSPGPGDDVLVSSSSPPTDYMINSNEFFSSFSDKHRSTRDLSSSDVQNSAASNAAASSAANETGGGMRNSTSNYYMPTYHKKFSLNCYNSNLDHSSASDILVPLLLVTRRKSSTTAPPLVDSSSSAAPPSPPAQPHALSSQPGSHEASESSNLNVRSLSSFEYPLYSDSPPNQSPSTLHKNGGTPPAPLVSLSMSPTQYTLSSQTDSPPPMMVVTTAMGSSSRQSSSTLTPKASHHHMVASSSMNSNLLTTAASPTASHGGHGGSGLGVNSTLSPSPMPEDQMRRCSHDPNIEKLHKSYISNVKLLSSAAQVLSSVSVSTDNTDSIPNLSTAINSGNNANSSIVGATSSSSSSQYRYHPTTNPRYPNNVLLNLPRSTETETDDERGDVINEIGKVNKWLSGNNNKQQFGQQTISEDDDSSEVTSTTTTTRPRPTSNKAGENESGATRLQQSTTTTSATSTTTNTGGAMNTPPATSIETNDSAIDVRSYSSISTLSRNSSSRRVNWHSFHKHYHNHFFQSVNTWSKYQISALSLEQIMALRKLALIQFSKLVERQHSKMIKTLRLISKKLAAAEFQRAYDSIDSINATSHHHHTELNSASAKSLKSLSNSSSAAAVAVAAAAAAVIGSGSSAAAAAGSSGLAGAPGDMMSIMSSNVSAASLLNNDSVLIDNRKVSHQLGAQMGCTYPSKGIIRTSNNNSSMKSKARRNKKITSSASKKVESSISVDDTSTEMQASTTNLSAMGTANNDVTPVVAKAPIPVVPARPQIFGASLSTIMQWTGQPLPQTILEAMRYIRKVSSNEVGLFRKNGNKARINRLKEMINNGEPINFQASDEITPFDISDTIKLYFRELPECLITNKLSEILLANYTKIRLEERKMILQQLMLLVPDENRLVLQTLLLFLNDIAKNHKTNQMNRTNLAVCFGPVIFSLNYDSRKKKLKSKMMSVPPSVSPSTSSKKQLPPAPAPLLLGAPQSTAAMLNVNTTNPLSISTTTTHDDSAMLTPGLSAAAHRKLSEQPIGSKARYGDTLGAVDSQKRSSMFETKPLGGISGPRAIDYPGEKGHLVVPNSPIQDKSSSPIAMTQSQLDEQQHPAASSSTTSSVMSHVKSNYKQKLNKAANSIVNFAVSGDLSSSSSSTIAGMSKESFDSLDYLSKVVQMCVADMIKYSMDLFTVPMENFEKLKLSATYGSEPHQLDYLYDMQVRNIKRVEFFTSNVTIDKTHWFYADKYEDVSIYYFKSESTSDLIVNTSLTNLSQQGTSTSTVGPTQSPSPSISQQQQSETATAGSAPLQSDQQRVQLKTAPSIDEANSSSTNNTSTAVTSNMAASISASLFIPHKNENFNDKLKLWKCCTLVKHPNMTLEKIVHRIKYERHFWDDDFKEGRIVDTLDDQTDLHRYVISFMPPHPSRDFFEIRHTSFQKSENEMAIVTSASVRHQYSSKLIGDIRANLIISKYVIEKLMATDTTTTFKITHYVKLDYKGFTLEFYNKTFGYMMARLLYNLKLSLLQLPNTS